MNAFPDSTFISKNRHYSRIERIGFLVLLLILFPLISSASVTLTYEYNALDRLSTAAYGTSFTETYTYDATGNRTSLAVSTGQRLQKAPASSRSTGSGMKK